MATFTVSGTGTLPDNTTPLRGTWTIAIQTSNGVAFDGDGSWRGGAQSFDTGTDGSLTVTLPQTDGDFLYVAAFKSRDLKTRIGPYAFDLTANTTWQHIIETPTLVPITPVLVDLVQGLADDVAADRTAVATDRTAVDEARDEAVAAAEAATAPTEEMVASAIRPVDDRHLAPKQVIERKQHDWVTQFAPGHGFTASNTYTSFADDTTDFAYGAQGARMIIAAPSSTGRVSKNGLPTRDLTHKVPILWVKTAALASIESYELYAGSGGLTNYFRMGQWSPVGSTRPTVDGRMTPIRFPKSSVSTTSGSPDWANITDWRIAITTSAAGNANSLLGGISLVDDCPQFPKGGVTHVFDDAIDDQYSAGRRILDKYGDPGVLAVVVERVETWPSSIPRDKVLDLLRRGWEICAHAYTEAVHVARLTGVTPDEALADLRQSKQWLLDLGSTSDSYVYPGGVFDEDTVALVSQFFNAARTTSARPKHNVFGCLDPMYLTADEPGATGLVNAKARVDEAYDNGLWLILNIHHVGAGGISEADYEELVDYIHTKVGMETVTMQQVFERLRIPAAVDALSQTTADARYRQITTLPQDLMPAVKTADTVRNNVATNPGADDPHLIVPLAANAKYLLRGFLDYDSSAAADLRIGWSTPAGVTMSWAAGGHPSSATASNSAVDSGAGKSESNTVVLGGIGVGVRDKAEPRGMITTGATAGNLVLRWNQGTADATDTTLRAGSWIELKRIA